MTPRYQSHCVCVGVGGYEWEVGVCLCVLEGGLIEEVIELLKCTL